MTIHNIWKQPATDAAKVDRLEQDYDGTCYYVTPFFPFSHHFASESWEKLGQKYLANIVTFRMSKSMIYNLPDEAFNILFPNKTREEINQLRVEGLEKS